MGRLVVRVHVTVLAVGRHSAAHHRPTLRFPTGVSSVGLPARMSSPNTLLPPTGVSLSVASVVLRCAAYWTARCTASHSAQWRVTRAFKSKSTLLSGQKHPGITLVETLLSSKRALPVQMGQQQSNDTRHFASSNTPRSTDSEGDRGQPATRRVQAESIRQDRQCRRLGVARSFYRCWSMPVLRSPEMPISSTETNRSYQML